MPRSALRLATLPTVFLLTSPASAQQLSTAQIEQIERTTSSICNIVKDAIGRVSKKELEADVHAKVGGMIKVILFDYPIEHGIISAVASYRDRRGWQ